MPSDLADRYLAGAPVAELAADAGVDPSTIWRRLRAEGVELRGRPDQGAGERLTRRWLSNRLGQGIPIATMAEEAGCDESTVRDWIARRGLHSVRVDPIAVEERTERAQRVAAAYLAGDDRATIAEREQCSVRTVSRLLAAAGVTGRPGRPVGS